MCDLLTLRAILSGDPDDEPTYPEWTYGGYLLESDWDDSDIVLRNVVARCLCDDPSRRRPCRSSRGCSRRAAPWTR